MGALRPLVRLPGAPVRRPAPLRPALTAASDLTALAVLCRRLGVPPEPWQAWATEMARTSTLPWPAVVEKARQGVYWQAGDAGVRFAAERTLRERLRGLLARRA